MAPLFLFPPCVTAVCASTMSVYVFVCVCVCAYVCDSWVPFCAISASFHAPFFSIFALECLRLVAMSWQGLSLPWLTASHSPPLCLPLLRLKLALFFCQLAIALPISLLQIIYNFCACAGNGPDSQPICAAPHKYYAYAVYAAQTHAAQNSALHS